ncbi:MAG: phosphate ABC transporter permease subunit PstC, partial [Mycobacterium sp.]
MLGGIRDLSREGLAVRWLGGVGAVIPLLALVFVLVTLILEALPAIRLNGLHFFT